MQALDLEAANCRERAKDLERNMGAAALLKAEQEALLFSLRKDLRSALETKEDLVRNMNESEGFKAREESLKEKISEYESTVNSLQNLLDDKSAMITRLRQESQVRFIICYEC